MGTIILSGILLTGCRVRTTGLLPGRQQAQVFDGIAAEPETDLSSGPVLSGMTEEALPDDGEPAAKTREDPTAEHRIYDPAADALIRPDEENLLHTEGSGNGSFILDPKTPERSDRQQPEAQQKAQMTEASEQAEDTGVSEEAKEAGSAFEYYTTLLKDRLGTLFECKRKYVYWETATDHETVFRDSPEHELITGAGAYDVSNRLLQENLQVDDGWIERKNPGAIVKVTDSSVLGGTVFSLAGADALLASIENRPQVQQTEAVRNGRVLLISEELLQTPSAKLFAQLLLAKMLYPDLFEDLDPEEAFEQLTKENTGAIPSGIYYDIPGPEAQN